MLYTLSSDLAQLLREPPSALLDMHSATVAVSALSSGSESHFLRGFHLTFKI